MHADLGAGRLRKNEVSKGQLETLGNSDGIRVGSVNENDREVFTDHPDDVGRPQKLDELPGHQIAYDGEGCGRASESDEEHGQEVLVSRGALDFPVEHPA